MQDETEDIDIESSLITFAEEVLGLSLYDWQIDSIEPFDNASNGLIMVTLRTPNGSGKTSVCIVTLILGWLALYRKGRVVYTTADSKQIDSQLMPALNAHRGKFPSWDFHSRKIATPTGGDFRAWVTDEPGRAEGFHKLDDEEGPLLIICDEAKSIAEEIFNAIDRCTFNALLLTSSPGRMAGRFYDSQMIEKLGYIRLAVGLKDCPHIPDDKIERLKAQYGEDGATPNTEFLRSTLDGEFMAAEGEARFNREGLARLSDMANAHDKLDPRDPLKAAVGYLEEGQGLQPKIVWKKDDSGPFWIVEGPKVGRKYVGFCDPATGEQAEGSQTRDGCSGGVLGLAYTDEKGVSHPDEPVAFLHGHNGTAVHWDNDIVAESLDILLRFYGDPPINVEANNAGVEVIRILQLAGRTVCRRKRRDHKNPGKLTEIVGFQTNAASKMEWVGALASAIREQTIDVRYSPAVSQLTTFILDEKGRGCAQAGAHDDHVTGLGLALLAKHWAKQFVAKVDQFLGAVPYGTSGRPEDNERVGGAWS